MKGLISSREAVGWFEREGRQWEVCATSEADYDEPRSELVVQFGCFARPADPRARETHISVAWLPRPAEVREGVSHAEAPELAGDIPALGPAGPGIRSPQRQTHNPHPP